MITEEIIARVKSSLQREKAFLTLEMIEELEKQIKKMKCCGNCDNNSYCEKERYGNDKGCKDWGLAE